VTKRNTVGTQHVTKIHTQMNLHTAQGPQHAEEYSVMQVMSTLNQSCNSDQATSRQGSSIHWVGAETLPETPVSVSGKDLSLCFSV